MAESPVESILVIPAIDLKGGACVRLRQGLMEDSTVFSEDPVATAMHWREQGARRLHMVDLDGAFQGKPVHADVIATITDACPDLPVQVGGGIRSLETAGQYLEAGVRYVILGTQAVREPKLVAAACREFPDHIIVGLDAKNGQVATDGWAQVSELAATDLAKRFEQDGVSAIVYTDIARDGMMQGVNLEATLKMADASSIPVIASGGITDLADIEALMNARHGGIIGAITGRAIYEGTLDLAAAQALADGVV